MTPYLIVSDAARALQFYQKAFGATELMRFPGPNGKIMHAEMKLGDSRLMLSDENREMGARSPQSVGGASTFFHLYVEDVDRLASQAVAAGAKVLRPVQDQFYGDRSGIVEDPFGHIWNIATHKEDLTPEELEKRSASTAPA